VWPNERGESPSDDGQRARSNSDTAIPDTATSEIEWSPRLGSHLEASRLRAGKRRVDLAFELGVSEETIRLWEKGAVRPSPERLVRLIALLSLETVDLPPPEPLPDLPPLARRLREEREARAISQAEAGLILDVHQATYAGWETGRSTPRTYFFAGIAAFLGITEQDVAGLCASPFFVATSGWPPLGRLIGAQRQALRLTRTAVAEGIGVTPNTIAAWELGYRVPGSTQLRRLADLLQVDMVTLAAALPHRNATTKLGELILARQRELGLRSTDVAERVGTTEATVSRWVHGHSRPASGNLRRLAKVLEVPFEPIAEAARDAA
jgi:transcriptional regulator with XRE-family HTH domain